MVVYEIQKICLLSLILLLSHTCHASITITYPTTTIVPGSTIVVTWINSTTTDLMLNRTLDIKLIKYHVVNLSLPSTSSTTIIANLGSNIKASKLSYSVQIPSNLYSNLNYSIIFMHGRTQIASSWPLTIVYVPENTSGGNATLTETNISPMTETNITTMTKTSSLSVSSSTSLITASSTTHLQHSSDVAGNDIGPTLTSDQVAYIAMSIVGILGSITIFYFLLKWMYERRKASSTRQSIWDGSPSTSTENSIYFRKDKFSQNYQPGSIGTNASIGRKFTVLENINEEENTQYYDSQYYSRFYTTTESLTIPTEPVSRQEQQSLQTRPTSPFGEMPTMFNGNRYDQLPLPPPRNTYSQHQ